MRKITIAAAVLFALLPGIAAAQQTLPANTVWGRLALPTQGGPAQAIPFAKLFSGSGLPAGPQSCSSHNWFNTLSSAGVLGCSQPSFADITGNISISSFNGGAAASSSTFWRGDGQWAAPTGSGNVNGTGGSVVGNVPQLSNTSTTGITDSGIPSAASPQALGLVPAATPLAATFTVTIASPAVVTETGYTPSPNDVWVPTTTGALPTGLTAGTAYFVIGSSISGSTFKVGTSLANAKAGTAVNTTGTQSGTHTGSVNTVIPAGFKGHIDSVTLGSGSVVNIPFQTPTTVNSLSLGPGIYDCSGELEAQANGSTLTREVHAVITTTAPPTLTSLPNIGNGGGEHVLGTAAGTQVVNFGPGRYVFTAPSTTLYEALYLTFGTDANGSNGAGTTSAYGYMRCETK